jgi:hypothetical protein
MASGTHVHRLLVVIGALVWAFPALAGCPPFSAPAPGHENDEVVSCHCLPGFKLQGEQQNKQCRPVAVRREPVMRPMSHAECVNFHQETRTGADKFCSADFYDCLREHGMSLESAGCVATTALLASERTRANAVGALATCGQQAIGTWRSCSDGWDRCRLDAARTYEASVQTCPGG